MSGIMWECKCGHLEYGEEPPEDCPKCLRINNFTQVPEDLMEQKTGGLLMEEKEGYKDEMGIDDLPLDEIPRSKIKKEAKATNKKSKISKVKKTRRRK